MFLVLAILSGTKYEYLETHEIYAEEMKKTNEERQAPEIVRNPGNLIVAIILFIMTLLALANTK